MASTAVSTVPNAVITTTGRAAFCRLTVCRNSSPFMPGSFRSVSDQIDRVLAQQFQAGFGVSGGKRGEAVLAEIQLEQAAHLGFVFDNQNGRHGRSSSIHGRFKAHEITRCAIRLPRRLSRQQPGKT